MAVFSAQRRPASAVIGSCFERAHLDILLFFRKFKRDMLFFNNSQRKNFRKAIFSLPFDEKHFEKLFFTHAFDEDSFQDFLNGITCSPTVRVEN